ncbi:MAG: hypothetical protein N3G21_08110 [Candidatus Hydrogenedentes bacterium]|nr:hypothetical protein [Candidatus Hydrogenedentota bacterium]
MSLYSILKRLLSKTEKEKDNFVHQGGEGESLDSAVIVKGAQNEASGILAEYKWI